MSSSDEGATKPIHVLEGSTKDSLEALFNVLRQPQDGGQLPLHKRNLPKSFFHPPSSQQGSSLSSDNISIQTGTCDTAQVEHVTLSMTPQCFTVGTDLGLVIAHSKAHSMPAALQGTIISGIDTTGNIEHSRQSSDVVPVNIITSNDLILYTQGNQVLSSLNEPQKMVVMKFQVCRLPDGWELALDDNQLVYFINHNNQTTSWFDPRLPETFQSWGMTLETLEECHLRYAQHLKEQLELKQRQQQQQQSSQTAQLFVGRQKCTPLTPGGLVVPSPLPSCSASPAAGNSASSVSPQPPPQPPAAALTSGGLTSVQHSHQSSLDSGMASAHSTASASHTPEHNNLPSEDALVSKNVGTSSPVDFILDDFATPNFQSLQDEDILSSLEPMIPMEDYAWSSDV